MSKATVTLSHNTWSLGRGSTDTHAHTHTTFSFILASFNLALDGRWCSMPLPGQSTPEKKSGTHCNGWDLGPVWTAAENFVQAGIQSPDSPACSESLYQPRYLNPHIALHARGFTVYTPTKSN